jgi:hypothetical protein
MQVCAVPSFPFANMLQVMDGSKTEGGQSLCGVQVKLRKALPALFAKIS